MWGPNLLRGMIRCKYTTNISPSQEYEQENQNYDEIIEKFMYYMHPDMSF
mgnify:CR=1 FL=1